jgi:hypothetical protein
LLEEPLAGCAEISVVIGGVFAYGGHCTCDNFIQTWTA